MSGSDRLVAYSVVSGGGITGHLCASLIWWQTRRIRIRVQSGGSPRRWGWEAQQMRLAVSRPPFWLASVSRPCWPFRLIEITFAGRD